MRQVPKIKYIRMLAFFDHTVYNIKTRKKAVQDGFFLAFLIGDVKVSTGY